MAIWGFDPPEQPDLPSGAGTTLALPSSVGATLPIGGGEAPSERFDPAAIRDPSAQVPTGDTFFGMRPDTWRKVELFSAGVQDAVDALQGKSGTALRDVLTRRSGTAREARKEKVEEERLGLERGRFTLEQIREARAIQTQQNQTFDAMVKLASEQAPRIMAIGADKVREASINAIVEEARGRGGDRTATVVQGLLRMPQIGQMFAPLMRDLREEDAAGLRQLAVVAAQKGELDAGLQRAQQIALPITNATLLNQMRVVSGALRQRYEAKGEKIPIVVLEAAIQAAHPEDAPGTNPQLNLLRGLGDTYSKAQERVRGNLSDLGFEVPGIGAEVAKTGAIETEKQRVSGLMPLIDKDVAAALTEAGFDPRKMRVDDPIHRAALQAAQKTVKATALVDVAAVERAKQTVKQEFGEGKSLAERIEELRASGNTANVAKADRLLALQQKMKESIQINLPKTPPTEIIKDVQSTKLAARRLSRVVEKFDPAFVGMLGKAKGISTRFSDLPGIPAFAERKAFANDLIAMTNDVKKNLLGAARSAPELADVARFLPDPDQNLSVAEFVGNLEAFVGSYLDVVDVLPSTLKELDLKTVNLTEERAMLVEALGKLRAARIGLGLPPGLHIRSIKRIE